MNIDLWCGLCGHKERLETNIAAVHYALNDDGELGGDLVTLRGEACSKCKKKEQMHLSIYIPKDPDLEAKEKKRLEELENQTF